MMQSKAEQDLINQQEWQNNDNWTLVYFSKKDSRWIVPKKSMWMGWTFNLGQQKGAWMFILSFLVPIALLAAALVFAATQ